MTFNKIKAHMIDCSNFKSVNKDTRLPTPCKCFKNNQKFIKNVNLSNRYWKSRESKN